jgi:hypothetical protein
MSAARALDAPGSARGPGIDRALAQREMRSNNALLGVLTLCATSASCFRLQEAGSDAASAGSSGADGGASAAGGATGAGGVGGHGAAGAGGGGTAGGVGGHGPAGAGGGGSAGTGGAIGAGGAIGVGGAAAGAGGVTGAGGVAGTGAGGATSAGGGTGAGGAGPPAWTVMRGLDSGAQGTAALVDGTGDVTLLTWHDGNFYSRALARTDAAWSPTKAIFSCGGTCSWAQADMNASGVGAAAWLVLDASTGYYTANVRRYVGGQWESQAHSFSPGAAYGLDALVVSPPGTIHLLYNASLLTFASPTGAWPTPTAPIGSSLSLATNSFLSFDGDGNGYLASDSQGNIVAARFIASNPSSPWLPPQLVSKEMTAYPMVACDGAGDAVAVWTRATNLGTSRYSKAAGWTALPDVTPLVSTTVIQKFAIAGDGGTGFFVSWAQQNGPIENYYAVRSDDAATWGPVALVSDGDHSVASRPILAADAKGNAVALWLQGTSISSLDVVAARYEIAKRAWSAPVTLSAAPDNISVVPSLAVSSGGVAAAAWFGSAGNVSAAVFR